MHFDPAHLSALSAVLHLGSFDAAAASLGVTPSAVSQRIRALEERVGTPLVHRAAPCTGTEAGLRIAKHAEDVAMLEHHLSRDLSLEVSSAPARIKIAVNADSLAQWFVAAMAEVEGILFDLEVDDQDHQIEWLRRGAVSAAITSEARPVAGCDVFPLGRLEYVATTCPAYIARWFPDGLTPEAFARAPCLIFNAKDKLQHRWLDTHVAKGIMPPAHFLPSTQGFLDAAMAGLGWGMNPELLARPALEAGTMVELIPGSRLDTPLYWQVSRIMAPALRPLTQAVRRAAARSLLPMKPD